jgi:outer membrane protein assembly factor BamB
VKWSIPAGDQTTSTPVVAGDKVFVGANNGAGYLERYPKEVDLGTLLCFRASDGKFLWQHSSEKLATGRIHDWPTLGVCSSPCVEGDRLWFFTNRGEVLCLDTEGFLDGENDGPVTDEPNENRDEADIVWRLDMMRELGVVPLQKFCCSPTTFGDLLFVNTSNSLREDHLTPANPQAPSFLALDKRSGRVVWSDNSPGEMVLGIGVGSPAVGVLGGVPQVIFPGNDGWLYSFRADEGNDGKPQPLWKFDCNPKTSQWMHGGRGTRNNLITTPVIHDGLVYIAGGRNPEHGEGPGRLWCIDPTRRGDVSSELAVKASDHSQLLPRRRLQAVDESKDEAAIANPNSAAVWHFAQFDLDGDGKIAFEEQMHRSASNATIKDGLLLVTDISGLVHCLDAKTGRLHWTHDLFAACWGTPLIVDGKVIVGDEDGDVTVLRLSDTLEVLGETTVDTSVYATPIVAGGVLYIASRTRLYAITADE